MSKERAKRRALKEAERARAVQREAERQARQDRRRATLARLTPRPVRFARQRGVLAKRQRAQNGIVAVAFLLVQVITWLVWSSWGVSFAVLVVSLLFIPVVVTLAFDRRNR